MGNVILLVVCDNVFGFKFKYANIVIYLCEVLVKYAISFDLKILIV